MLQERIEELESAILDYKPNNKVYVMGFMSEDRLNDYYINGIYCHYLQGLHDNRVLNWGKVKNNALFVIINNGNEIGRYQFMVLIKDVVKFKDSNNKLRTKTYTIRKCKYTNMYNIISRETISDNGKKISEEDNRLFDTVDDLKEYFFESFGSNLDLEIDYYIHSTYFLKYLLPKS